MNALSPDLTQVDLKELIELSAVDTSLFERSFFPKAFRQPGALYHPELDGLLMSLARLVNVQVHRDGAKTTKLRAFTAKRIAYGTARTILYIGKSEGHALRSVRWIRKQIEQNHFFAQTFQLRKGTKWQDHECEIIHETLGHTITIIGMGIEGSTRGINIDDHRPDLIIVDDVIDAANASTKEQRVKIENAILSDLKNSLAPASESPDAKMVILQTPLDPEDASCKAFQDEEFISVRYGCWTKETEHLPVDQQMSSWPARYPTETLRAEKRAAIARNKLSLFMREKECLLTNPEECDFLPEWLQYYDIDPPGGMTVYAIDPVPPPTELQLQKGLKDSSLTKRDYEVHAVVTKWRGNYYLRHLEISRGHTPEWTINTFFSILYAYTLRCVVVETFLFQRVLAWMLKKAMELRRKYALIKPFEDTKSSKRTRIVQALNGPASNKKIYVKKEHSEFISQFLRYPKVEHDDVIDAVSLAVAELQGLQYEEMQDGAGEDGDSWKELMASEKEIPELEYASGGMCP